MVCVVGLITSTTPQQIHCVVIYVILVFYLSDNNDAVDFSVADTSNIQQELH